MNKKILILIVVVIVLIVLAVILAFFLNRQNGTGPANSGNPLVETYRNQLPELSRQASQNPNDSRAIRNYAVALYATGDLESAKDQYLKEKEINSNDPVLYNNLGNIYRDSGEYQQAVNAYQQSIDLDKNQLNVYVNLANLYIYVLQQPEMGYGVYLKGIENSPNNKLSLLLPLANAYKDAGLKQKAIETYNQILEIDSNNTAAKSILSTLE